MTDETVVVANTTDNESNKVDKQVVTKISAEEIQARMTSGGLENKSQIRKVKQELGIGGQAKKDWDSILIKQVHFISYCQGSLEHHSGYSWWQ